MRCKTTNTSVQPIWESRQQALELKAALTAGWRRRDIYWERLQEEANVRVVERPEETPALPILLGWVISFLLFSADDPRRITSSANLGFLAGRLGANRLSGKIYARAEQHWVERATHYLINMQIKPRARSSLFHMRMEHKHRDAYHRHLKTRQLRFIEETAACLKSLSNGQRPGFELYRRWKGEKLPVFDESRKLMAACLLVLTEPNPALGVR